jgi:hypothetical protein
MEREAPKKNETAPGKVAGELTQTANLANVTAAVKAAVNETLPTAEVKTEAKEQQPEEKKEPAQEKPQKPA